MPINYKLPPKSRKRVLVVAFACSPIHGSECAVGWNGVKMVASFSDVTVLTTERYQSEIEQYLEDSNEDWLHHVNFLFIKHDLDCRLLDRIWPPYNIWAYQYWLKKAYKVASNLAHRNQFDACHLMTYVTFRYPGLFYKLKCPLVWGPIGALENTPWHLITGLGPKAIIHFTFRNLINSLHKRYLLSPKRAFRKAKQDGAIISATPSIQKEIRQWYGVDSTLLCEVTSPDVEGGIPIVRDTEKPIRLCWSGLHDPAKALHFLLHALAILPPDVNFELNILGAGNCSNRWKLLAKKLDIDSHCIWHGQCSRQQALNTMRDSHLFIITSLKDLTSTVLLEALTFGIPVLCPDICGFPGVVDSRCGKVISINSTSDFINDLSLHIKHLHQNEAERRLLSKGALLKATEYTLESKTVKLWHIYETVWNNKT